MPPTTGAPARFNALAGPGFSLGARAARAQAERRKPVGNGLPSHIVRDPAVKRLAYVPFGEAS